eukprot:gene11063-18670_t
MADNEISLNIEETNKLRLSLGLKPLKLTSDEPSGPTPQELARDKKIEQDKLAADLKARIASHRTKRQHEAFMAVKALGEADNDETDDLRSWVSSSRVKAAQFKSEQGAKKAEEEERAMSDSDDDEGKYSSKDLAGLKVKHDANEIIEGETVILTLADKHILTAKGTIDEENDELENVLKAEHKKREKAMEASGKKAKPLYDEQEEEAMLIDAAGGVAMEKARRQEEMRKKLDAGNKILDSASAAAKAVGDYYTEGELAAMKPVEDEDTANVIKALDAEAAAKEEVEEEDTADVTKALDAEAAAKEEVEDKDTANVIKALDAEAAANEEVEEVDTADVTKALDAEAAAKEEVEEEDTAEVIKALEAEAAGKEEVEEEDTADVIKALEEEAAAKEKAGLDDGTYAELGTRSERKTEAVAKEEAGLDDGTYAELGTRSEGKATMEAGVKAEQQAAEEKYARFDRAVDKANWAATMEAKIKAEQKAAEEKRGRFDRAATNEAKIKAEQKAAEEKRACFDCAATMEAKVKAEQKAAEEKRARFDRAVDKANWASLALKNQPKEMAPGEEEVYGDEVDNELYESLARARRQEMAPEEEEVYGDEVDNELFESLARARRQVQVKTEDETKPSLDNIAASAAVKREEDETALKEDLKSGLAFTETSEFVRNIQAAKAKDLPGSKAQTDAKAEDLDVYMDDDVKVEDVKSEPESEEDMGGNPQGRWVAAEGEGGGRAGRGGRQIRKRDRDGDEDEDEAGSSKGHGDNVIPKRDRDGDEDEDEAGSSEEHGDNVVNEASGYRLLQYRASVCCSTGPGLAGVLGLLKDKGEFTKDRIVWAGRNHDKSKVALQGLGDTYTGGAHEEHYARSIETALTKKDEFGRILTPKERFRDLCYQFHGIQPSKNKQAKRLKKAAEEIAMHKVATSEFNKDVEKMMAVHKMTALPYIPLSGKDAAKSLQAAAASSNLGKPAKGSGKGEGKGKYLGHLGGGQTPLLGDRKVEAMLGVRKG